MSISLFGHEVLHNVYEHLGRSKQNKHNPNLANIAADYCVNRDLKINRIGTFITTVPHYTILNMTVIVWKKFMMNYMKMQIRLT